MKGAESSTLQYSPPIKLLANRLTYGPHTMLYLRTAALPASRLCLGRHANPTQIQSITDESRHSIRRKNQDGASGSTSSSTRRQSEGAGRKREDAMEDEVAPPLLRFT